MLKDFLASLGMFTKIKVRDSVFSEGRGPFVLCWFPLDGALCGSLSAAVFYGLTLLTPDRMLSGAVMTLSLFVVSGFLHLDGFMDCADSLLSSRDREGKLRILKDSNVGAFAVISVALLLMILFSSMSAIADRGGAWQMFIAVPFASRAFTALILFTLRPIENNRGLLYYFGNGRTPAHVICVALEFAAALAAGFVISPAVAAVIASGAAVSFIFAKTAEALLGGINGDVIGAGVIIFEAVSYLIYAFTL